MKRLSSGRLAGVLLLTFATTAGAQESKSAPLAKELHAALDASKSDSIAAKDSASPDMYIGALYIPGFELLVIAGKYSAPALLDGHLAKKEYKDIYLEMNGAVTPDTRIFIEDAGVDGLSPKRSENQPFDSVELHGKRTALDGDWKKQKVSEEDYMKAFTEADEQYAKFLTALIAQSKK